jgi:hypothetical protein
MKILMAMLVVAAISMLLWGCDKPKDGGTAAGGGGGGSGKTIVVDGSDTMVNLSQAWAEAYTKLHPDVKIEVSGGGSGVGIASLIGGKVDMANASRKMEEKEIAKFKEQNGGKEPMEHIRLPSMRWRFMPIRRIRSRRFRRKNWPRFTAMAARSISGRSWASKTLLARPMRSPA